ncbi:Methylase of chemotaxis methyl-accepting protein [uncultured Alphaproteobacteria bacterium]|uniref:Methylase of chemotaxis methyl-accepting protein n=1 Tax=uncultured Alphaproteobacteria bacterium TaxID=91750 RepID=A0A212JM02_9PROT|nr:Methylase of chemotaxis methyl-accepting protein [uncultured Alphaproteobacteria bacterium]
MTSDPLVVENQRLEIRLLLEAIYQRSGYDFRGYASAHIKRRLDHVRARNRLDSFCEMIHKLIYEPPFFEEVLQALSINVTEMFRDPQFYRSVRENVVPHLKTFPFIKVWHAGCAAGQEVYSMAILLEEEGMLSRAQIYGTDISPPVLEVARRGIYPLEAVRQYTSNYQKAGGTASFADYYTAGYESVAIAADLKKNVLFSPHNLVTDGIFGEMHMIFCRNVLIYFGEELQEKVIKLFLDSLRNGGFLCLGTKESLRFSAHADAFEVVDAREKIYRKRHLRTTPAPGEP